MKARLRRKTKTTSDERIRQEVESWPHDVLLQFVMDLIDTHDVARKEVERAIISKGQAGAAVTRYRQEIDKVLSIDFVDWKEIGDYQRRLLDVLHAIEKLGANHPADALGLVWYFIEEIPAIFESVHDECEIAEVCSDLMEAVVKLSAASGGSASEMGRRLIDVYLSDTQDTCRFDEALEILLRARMDKTSRETIAGYAQEKAASLDAYARKALGKFVRGLRAQRGRGRPSRRR